MSKDSESPEDEKLKKPQSEAGTASDASTRGHPFSNSDSPVTQTTHRDTRSEPSYLPVGDQTERAPNKPFVEIQYNPPEFEPPTEEESSEERKSTENSEFNSAEDSDQNLRSTRSRMQYRPDIPV